ncbi:hypothetical protein GCM10010492_66040 [Saccharothrix mutabilis subsp. mutabilis]|uniref:Uncharacterized protein n=1 Tax=Saccharothrix mutabilis subsp. mutabilis TaxID=66855 RepID=A0ABN0UN12_9PSEU
MTAPQDDREREYDAASRASLDEQADGPLDQDNPPGRSDTGSAHPEANPTGSIGVADHAVGEDPDRG